MKNSLIIFVLFLFVACKKDSYESGNRDFGILYIVNSPGAYSIFDVQKINYNDFNNIIDTLNYQILELNDSFFTDNLNENVMRVEQFYRDSASAPWIFQRVIYSKLNKNSFTKQENNIKSIHLVFPLNIYSYWNKNELNTNTPNYLYYENFNINGEFNNKKYNNIVIVKSDYINNLVREKSYKQVFAKNIGLIYSKEVFIEKFESSKKKRGYEITYQLYKHAN